MRWELDAEDGLLAAKALRQQARGGDGRGMCTHNVYARVPIESEGR